MARPIGKTLATVVEETAVTASSHPAVFYGDEVVSYGELHARATEAAKALLALGIGAGDRVGVLLGNNPHWVVMVVASSMIGACFVPLNTWYKKTELAWTMAHAELSVVVSARQFLKTDYGSLFSEIIPQLGQAMPGAPKLEAWPRLRALVFIGAAPRGGLEWSAFLKRGESISQATLDAARRQVKPDAVAYILYTSGSTAEPKGVMLSHRGIVENGFDLGQRRALDAEDRVWLGTPLFYALGATNALPAALTAGGSLVLQDSFDAGTAIEMIHKTAATVYYATGNISHAILGHPDYAPAKIGSLKKGNAGIGTEYKRLTLVEMGISRAVPAYGLTETYGNATVGYADDPLEMKLRTNGPALPGMELVIVDPTTNAPLPRGETGLVLIRGHTTLGYLNNPTETAKALRPDGFFDTGDLGALDAEGYFIFHSRLKEVIKSNGINVSPTEVEQLLVTHPDVRDAYVVGVADKDRGELIVAFVDCAAPIAEHSLRDFIKERAASFKVPHHILFRREDQIPRLASGKVAKVQLMGEAKRELGL
jgi:fatty-acyl-CoA synthase